MHKIRCTNMSRHARAAPAKTHLTSYIHFHLIMRCSVRQCDLHAHSRFHFVPSFQVCLTSDGLHLTSSHGVRPHLLEMIIYAHQWNLDTLRFTKFLHLKNLSRLSWMISFSCQSIHISIDPLFRFLVFHGLLPFGLHYFVPPVLSRDYD